jgi:tRNA(fMet)-specific endonuclease VapC
MIPPLLLDTDTLSLLRSGHPKVNQHAANYLRVYGRLAFADLTWYEAVRGYRAAGAHSQLLRFESFCQRCDIIELDSVALEHATYIYADLKQRGELIGDLDMLIAGIAFAHGMGVATRNVAHFSRITGLHVEDWTQ